MPVITEIPWMEAETKEALLTAVNSRLRDIQEALDGIVAGVGGGSTTIINNTTVTPGAGTPVTVIALSLGAVPTPIGIPAVTVGDLVLYVFVQDAIGNGEVTWDPAFNDAGGADPGQPGKTANTYSTIWMRLTAVDQVRPVSHWLWNKVV